VVGVLLKKEKGERREGAVNELPMKLALIMKVRSQGTQITLLDPSKSA
jgi:hypothetical protein